MEDSRPGHSTLAVRIFDRSKYDVRYGSGSFFENLGNRLILDDIELEVTLVNTGNRPSSEVVMVFSQDRLASITPSVDKLKAYKRVIVDAGATDKVRLSVSTSELGFIGHDLGYVIEPGVFGLRVQDQVVDIELNK